VLVMTCDLADLRATRRAQKVSPGAFSKRGDPGVQVSARSTTFTASFPTKIFSVVQLAEGRRISEHFPDFEAMPDVSVWQRDCPGITAPLKLPSRVDSDLSVFPENAETTGHTADTGAVITDVTFKVTVECSRLASASRAPGSI
jgi:hypothetical protein